MATLTRSTDSEAVADGAGRVGLIARGFVYCLLGVLALVLAFGGTSQGDQVDQRGAIKELAEKPLGRPLLVALIIGFLAYALWRVLRAFNGEGHEEPDTKSRLVDAGKVVIYLGFAYSTFKLLVGDEGSGQQQAQQEFTAQLMAEQAWGRWAVGLVGGAVIGVGLWQCWRGVEQKFRKRLTELVGEERKVVVALGVAGHVARGVVIGVIGLLLIRAAVRFDGNQPVGVDAALKEVVSHSYGPFVLAAVAAGVFAFGLYSFAEAKYRTVS
ncbi:MAG: DUF1206 domain-containing protein [Actinomycetota bacterium]|nr:DUF1206 domain-containing protein [Acidimicrobiia bacterium]MDQ3293111.1 DUF1206 domain-containing protein [Actinomycetota bacterium]